MPGTRITRATCTARQPQAPALRTGAHTQALRQGPWFCAAQLARRTAAPPPPATSASAVHAQVDLASDTRANVLGVSLQDVLAQTELDVFTASNTTPVSGAGLAAGAGAGVHQLMITGDANDVADIDLSAWTQTDTVVAVGGQTYQVYNATQAAAQLLIDQHIVNAGHVL